MLQKIRDRSTGWVSIFLFIIIGLAFALWGVPNEFTSRNKVVQVNGEEIPLEEVRRAYRNQLNQFQQFSTVTPEQEEAIRNQVLQGLVVDEVLSQHSQDAGYHVGNDDLVKYIRNMEVFQDQGQFSMDLFQTRLSLQGMSPQYFEEQIRRALRISQIRRSISDTAFVTPYELEQRARLEREQRTAEWARISVDPASEDIEIPDEEIQAYYDDNAPLFMEPERVDIEYVSLNLDDMAAETVVTDQDLRDYYANEVEAGRFQAPEERRARHILVAVDGDTNDTEAKGKADELLARLEAGEDFSALAQELSDDPGSGPEGGDLGWAQREAYVGAFADALFSMAPGELRGPVRTEFGYHLIRMEEQRGGVPKTFEEVETELRAELGRTLAEDRYYESLDQMQSLSFENPSSLQPLADELELEVQRLDGILRSGSIESDIGANLAVIDAAFSERVLDQGENSDLIELMPEHRLVLRVAEHHPSTQRPLEEVRDTIVTALRESKARELARERGEALLAQLREGDAQLGELSSEPGVEYNEADQYRRTSGLPPALRDSLFKAEVPEAGEATIEGLQLDDGSYGIYALMSVTPGSIENLGAADGPASQEGIGDLTAYITQLREDASVILQPDLLQ